MINFRFVRTQLKNLIIPLIAFFVILLVLLIPALTQTYFAPAISIHKTPSSWSGSSQIGAGNILINVFFGIPGFVAIVAFSIIFIQILITKEVDRGYFASWLTMPMSRRTILNSKLFALLSAVLMAYGAIFLMQIIFFPIILKDFSALVFGNIILYNFALILLALVWTSINWFIMCSFNTGAKAISVAASISTFFIVSGILAMLGNLIDSLQFLKYFKYLTITSLLNSPFSFGPIPSFDDSSLPPNFSGTKSAVICGAKAKDFVWQLPVMFVLPFGFFTLGDFIFIKKDLHL